MPGSRTRPLRCASLAVAAALLWATPMAAFDVHRHLFMTRDVLGELNGNALAAVQAGVIYPDISGCAIYGYCDGWKRVVVTTACRGLAAVSDPTEKQMQDLGLDHFDDNPIDDNHIRMSMWRSNVRVARARAILLRVGSTIDNDEERKLVNGALLLFGGALHGIQDFYSHSTYVECHSEEIADGKWAELPLWDGKAKASCPSKTKDKEGRDLEELVTGVWETAPGVEVSREDIIHGDLNKDNPETKQGKNTFGSQATPATYYQAVSGQRPGRSAPADDYDLPGLAVRHSIRAYRALVDGTTQVYSGIQAPRAVDATDRPAELVRLRGDSSPVEQVLAAAADDPGLSDILRDQLAETSFASCLLGGEAADYLLGLLSEN